MTELPASASATTRRETVLVALLLLGLGAGLWTTSQRAAALEHAATNNPPLWGQGRYDELAPLLADVAQVTLYSDHPVKEARVRAYSLQYAVVPANVRDTTDLALARGDLQRGRPLVLDMASPESLRQALAVLKDTAGGHTRTRRLRPSLALLLPER